MRDGIGIAVELWVPERVVESGKDGNEALREAERVPVIVQATRYWRELGVTSPAVKFSVSGGLGATLTSRGYALAVVDVRGTGASFGTWDAPFARAEIEDLREVVEWMTTQAWCNGRVGAFGTSYLGTTADLMASLGHPAIKAVIPRFSIFDAYGHVAMPGGVMNDWFIREWSEFNASLDTNDVSGLARLRGIPVEQAKMAVTGVKPVDGERGEELLTAAVAEHAGNVPLYAAIKQSLEFRDGRINGKPYTAAQSSIYGWRTQYEAAAVPSYVWASWMDGATAAGALARRATFDVPQRVVIGPWNHGGELDCDPFDDKAEASVSVPKAEQFESMMWFFDEHLKPSHAIEFVEKRVQPPFEPVAGEIAYYVMGAKEWRKTSVWPPAGLGTLTLHAGAMVNDRTWLRESREGSVSSLGVIQAHESVTSGASTRWQTQLGGRAINYGAKSTASWPLEHTLSFKTEEARWPIFLVGTPVIDARVVPSQNDGAVHAYLCAISPNGKRVVLSEGMRRLIHGDGGPVPPYASGGFGAEAGYFSSGRREVVPGKAIDLRIVMLPFAARVPNGWQLELIVAANDHGNFAEYPSSGGAVMQVLEASITLQGLKKNKGKEAPLQSEKNFQKWIVESYGPTSAWSPPTSHAGLSRVLLGERDTLSGAPETSRLSFELPTHYAFERQELLPAIHPQGNGVGAEKKPLSELAILGWDKPWGKAALERLSMHPDREALEAWLLKKPGLQKTAALGFLLANMPLSDLGAMRAPWLIRNIDLAVVVRERASWGSQLTDDLFNHYVLPHRVSQEPVDLRLHDVPGDKEWMNPNVQQDSQPTHASYWREILAAELWPRVKDLPMYEAAMEVNRWCWEWSGFSSNSSARDQGPLTTLQRELGRCEEGVILYVSAARAVGIPARACYTPYWAVNDNNHAWVEVWADGRWWYLGGGELGKELNHAWFSGPAGRAGIVISVAFGDVAEGGSERVYQRLGDVTLMNSTHVYGDVCRLSVTLPKGLPENFVTDVTVHVINFGTPRPIATFKSNSSVELGRGDYLVTAATPSGPVAAIATVSPKAPDSTGAIPGEVVSLTKDAFATLTKGDGSYAWLKYPQAGARMQSSAAAGESGANPEEGTESYAAMVKAGRRASPEQRRHLEAMSRHRRTLVLAARAELRKESAELALPEAFPAELRDRAAKQVARAGNSSAQLASAYKSLSTARELTDMVEMLEQCDDKALWEAQPGVLVNHAREFGRRKALTAHGASEKEWLQHGCSPRVDDEPLNWVWSGAPRFDPMRPDSQSGRAIRIADKLAALRKHADSRNGHVPTPPETWAAGGGTDRAMSILIVTLLRADGVAARISPSKRWAEFWNGQRWLLLYPFKDGQANQAEWNKPAASTAPEANDAAFLALPGEVRIHCQQLGEAVSWPEPFAQYAVTQFQRGRFTPEWLDLPAPKDGVVVTTLRPGQWYLFTASRNRRGDALFRCYPLTVVSGGSVTISAEFGIPPQEMDPKDLVPKSLALWPKAVLAGGDGSTSLQKIHDGKPTLVVVLEAASEPGRRMIAALPAIAKECEAKGINVRVVHSGVKGSDEYASIAKDAGASSLMKYDDSEGALVTEVGIKTLPCVVLLDADGTTKLWTEGYNPSIRGLVIAGLGQLGK